MSLFRAFPLLLLCAAVAACSSTPSSNSRIDYSKKRVAVQPLDVPPPLSRPGAGSEGVEVPEGGGSGAAPLLPQPENVRMARDGEARWLVVQAAPDALWPKVHDFLKSQSLDVRRDDARIGLIETDWAENRADIPESFIRGLFSKVVPYLYSADTRDMYRMRLERGAQPGTTEIFLSHYGVKKVNHGEEVVWEPRESDPELVAELLSRLMQYLGAPSAQAKAELEGAKSPIPPRARVDGDALVIDEGFPRAWRLTGLALDRVGLVVEDLNREKGLYYVRQTEGFGGEQDKRGWFGRLFSSDQPEEKRLRLLLKGDDNTSRLTAVDEKGEPLSAEVVATILNRLQEQLR